MSDASARANTILGTLKALLPREGFVALHEPKFSDRERALVDDCITSGWVSSVGKYVDQFEADLAAYMGARHAIACVNGTAALHISYQLAGIEAGDEVFCPSLTFIATVNALSYMNATPHFVDVDAERLTLCPVALEAHIEAACELRSDALYNRTTGARISAIVVMHTFGHPADLDALAALAQKYQLALVEDAAESLGSFYHGTHTGNHGVMSAVSFNGNKIITTGGGGAIITNDAALAKRAKHLTTQAKQPHAYEFIHDAVAYNYRLPNLNAALGVAQLEALPGFLEQKRVLAHRYRDAFAGMDGVHFVSEPKGCTSNYWLNALVLPDQATRDAFLDAAKAANIQARPIWRPMHLLDMYNVCPKAALPHTEMLYGRLVNIPSSAALAQH